MSLRGLVATFVGLALLLVGCAQYPIAAAPAPTATPTAAPSPSAGNRGTGGTRVSGTVKSVDANGVTLSDGTVISTTSQTRVTRLQPITSAALKQGMYVAVTAQRQPDNTLLASQVNVFDTTPQGASTFQRPMAGGNLMTNATVDKVSGDTFTVSWDGGGANVKLAPDAKLDEIVVGSLSDVKAGSLVSVQEANGVAQSISLQ